MEATIRVPSPAVPPLALGGGCDDRAEERRSAGIGGRGRYCDDGTADIFTDQSDALLVRGSQHFVVGVRYPASARSAGSPTSRSAGFDGRAGPGLLPLVESGAERGVQGLQHVGAVGLRGHGQDPDRRPCLPHQDTDPLGQFVEAAFIEDGQTHHVPGDGDRPNFFDLQHPAGGQPGPRAHGVEPEVDRRAGAGVVHEGIQAQSRSPQDGPGKVERSDGTDAGAEGGRARLPPPRCEPAWSRGCSDSRPVDYYARRPVGNWQSADGRNSAPRRDHAWAVGAEHRERCAVRRRGRSCPGRWGVTGRR